MYNLNMNGPGGSGLLSLPLPQGENSTTPRTPEIVNSLIAMSNPFESSYRAHAPRMASSPPGGSDASNSSSGSAGGMSPPSVQHTCSQLIKEGLKLTIQSKRRHALPDHETKTPRTDEVSGSGCSGGYDDDDGPFSPGDGLTPEDEERRRRRRERNKIAATKCRLKKRERTVNLVHESEILENQNHDLKSQIQELETQRRRLVDMLSVHRPSCTRHPPQTFDPTPSPFQTFPRPHPSPTPTSQANRMGVNYPRAPVDATMTYRRVETCVEPYRRMETVVEETSYCRGPLESTVYQHQHYDPTEAKDILTPYTRAALQTVESPPSFTRIADQYSCQNLTDLDQFVKPELPSMAGFHSPASTFSVDGSPVLTNTVSYHQFDDEADSFLDRGCMA